MQANKQKVFFLCYFVSMLNAFKKLTSLLLLARVRVPYII